MESLHPALSRSPAERRVLWRLVCTLPQPGRERLVASEVLPPRCQVRLSEDPRVSVRVALGRNPVLLRTLQHALAGDLHERVRRSVAASLVLHPGVALRLSTDRRRYVQSALARNPCASPEALHLLASSPDREVRRIVSRSLFLLPETFLSLLRSRSVSRSSPGTLSFP